MATSSGRCDARCVELGFIEKREPWALASKYFPSKVGGKPAWLSLKDIPGVNQVICKNCGEPCVFLLQVYAPIDDIGDAFHRTLYVFICLSQNCVASHNEGSVIVLRSQLPLVNPFYSKDPPQSSADDADSPCARDYNPICDVCGVLGDKKCAQCKSRSYCCKSHQVRDWRDNHKTKCRTSDPSGTETSKLLFPQFELVTEPEEEDDDDDDDVDERKRLSEYQDFVSKHPECKESPSQLKDIQDLQNMAATCKDKAFWKFRKETRKAPEQVLRYELGGTPLWVSSEGVPKDIPRCDCGAERRFEFQVMPQLLNTISGSDPDGVDWGTLTVFSCKKSCCCGTAYKEEYAWKQDFSNKDDVSS
ncbi:programmed cell death protein 2-like [Ornithodoros turicata]|uniref:programmed cell death protein 2-like n=1 Tax=Ornithodoros turicata TaxID=34597 RepID=UPI0031394E56